VSHKRYEIVTAPPGWKVLVGKWVHDFVVNVSCFLWACSTFCTAPTEFSTDFARQPILPKSILEE
jgi:hypothetical protein